MGLCSATTGRPSPRQWRGVTNRIIERDGLYWHREQCRPEWSGNLTERRDGPFRGEGLAALKVWVPGGGGEGGDGGEGEGDAGHDGG